MKEAENLALRYRMEALQGFTYCDSISWLEKLNKTLN